jgi:hypothetical protein
MQSLVDSALDFWLTAGRFAERFEREFACWMGVREARAGQPRIFGQPAGRSRADFAQARRPAPICESRR